MPALVQDKQRIMRNFKHNLLDILCQDSSLPAPERIAKCRRSKKVCPGVHCAGGLRTLWLRQVQKALVVTRDPDVPTALDLSVELVGWPEGEGKTRQSEDVAELDSRTHRARSGCAKPSA